MEKKTHHNGQGSSGNLMKSLNIIKKAPGELKGPTIKKNYRTQSCSPQLKTHFDTPSHQINLERKILPPNSKFFLIHNIEIEPIYEKKASIFQTPPRKIDSKGSSNNNKKSQKSAQKQQKLKLTQLKDIKPLNLEEQKIIFFQKAYNYNPNFQYQLSDLQFTIQKPHTKYMEQAIKILDTIIAEYGTEERFEDITGGHKLSQQETEEQFLKYISNLDYGEIVSLEFQENTVAPTSCIHSNQEGTSRIVVSLPIRYRKFRIMGVLNHEIGTHIIRKYNDKLQKWHKHRKKYDLQDYSKIEEGLACINQHFESAVSTDRRPLMFKAALHYYASVLASKMTFQELFIHLEKYQNSPDERWKTCVRVKRGICDTSELQGQYKDQIYLRGAIKILNNRKQLNFLNLHAGKITVKDCLRFTEKGWINTQNLKIPYFLQDMQQYLHALDRIAEVNFLN